MPVISGIKRGSLTPCTPPLHSPLPCPTLTLHPPPPVQVVRRAGSSHRRLSLHGSDGRVRYMVVQHSVQWVQHALDERILQVGGLECFD